MGQRVSPEFKQLHGLRELNDDGFTYRYGKHKGGYTKRQRHTNTIKRMVRHDKRAVRQAEDRRIAAESGI
jgi:hypothetical protein